MKRIIVDYKKRWDLEGYTIHQTIKLDKKLLDPIQKELLRVRESTSNNYVRDNVRPLNEEQLNNKRCIGITNLRVIKNYLYDYMKENGIPFCQYCLWIKRIKNDRNTAIMFY